MHYTVAIANQFPIFAGLVLGSCESNACETNTFYFLRSSSNEPIGNAWSPHRIAVQSYYCYDPMIIYACQRNNFTTKRRAWVLRTSGVRSHLQGH